MSEKREAGPGRSGDQPEPAGTPADLARARALLEGARRVLVLTGAGVSAESGIPTFRGTGGLWRSFRAEDLATPGAFARDPRLVWEWYGWRREVVAGCLPNAAHLALARWQTRREGVRIATQNVDGLHVAAAARVAEERPPAAGAQAQADERAQDHAKDLLEIHGTLFRVRCTRCRKREPHRSPIDASTHASLPRCGACGGLQRPDVVWFGEALDPDVLARALGWAESADACLVVGTSAVVQPAASLAVATREAGGDIVEVNPETTPLSPLAAVALRGPAAELIPALLG